MNINDGQVERMRLIDADKLIARFKRLKGPDILANLFISDVIKVIKQMPTAYDIDKVVEQLEERKGNVFIDGKKMYQEDYFIDIDDAIDIVKKGWVE